MEFDIIGAGSIGLLFAVKLKHAQYKVNVWTSTTALTQCNKLQDVGLVDEIQAVKLKLPCKKLSFEQIEQASRSQSAMLRYAIIAVKQTHLNETLLNYLVQLTKQRKYAAILALQNGRGHIEKLEQSLEVPILTAVTSEAAKRLERFTVMHTGRGKTWIGDELRRDIDSQHQKNVVKTLEKAGFIAFVSKNIKEPIYNKLLRNAVINPLTALFDVSNGQLPQSKQRLALMERLFLETKEVLIAEEPRIAHSSFDDILQLCSATTNNTSSMRADVLSGAVTEIAYINGAVAAIAKKHQLQAPLNNSMVHMIEALHPEQ